MGGPGSGNWYRWDVKDIVEDCSSIDIKSWYRYKKLAKECLKDRDYFVYGSLWLGSKGRVEDSVASLII